MNPFIWSLIPLFIIGIIIYVWWIMEKKRTEKLSAVSNSLKLNFKPKGNSELFNRLNQLHLFSIGRSKKIKNLMEGETEGSELAVFDYQYTTGGGQHSHTSRQSVFCIYSSKLYLPQFSMRPEGLFHKIGGAFGYQDIDFESHPRFSKKYLLRGDNETSVRQLFNDNLIKYIESKEKISLEGGGNQLVFYRPGKRVKPEDIESFMDEGFHFLKMFLKAT